MSNDPDRHADLIKAVAEMSDLEIVERIETLEDALHGFKGIAALVKLEMDLAAGLLTKTLAALNKNDPNEAYTHAAKSFAAIAVANHAAKRVV